MTLGPLSVQKYAYLSSKEEEEGCAPGEDSRNTFSTSVKTGFPVEKRYAWKGSLIVALKLLGLPNTSSARMKPAICDSLHPNWF